MMDTMIKSNRKAMNRLKKVRSSGVSLGSGARNVAAAQGIRKSPSPENSKVHKNIQKKIPKPCSCTYAKNFLSSATTWSNKLSFSTALASFVCRLGDDWQLVIIGSS